VILQTIALILSVVVVSAALADPALSARVGEVMRRTDGVAREVNRFLIECAGDGAQYDQVATQVYYAKFRKLLTAEGSAEFDVKLRSSFSVIMAGLHQHYPVPFASIPTLWKDSGIVVLAADARTAQFVCPAQKRAVDELFYELTHAALKEAVHFLVSHVQHMTSRCLCSALTLLMVFIV
jgi:hypothetical protein